MPGGNGSKSPVRELRETEGGRRPSSQGPKVPGYPTPPAAPPKSVAAPLPSRFSADVSAGGGPSGASRKSPSLRDVATKSSGAIRPLSKGRR